jgi:hypothetical protein
LGVGTVTDLYAARRIRASRAEMAQRHDQIAQLVEEHQPCTVRQIYYRAVVAGVDGVTKTQSGYEKVQRACLDLRRSGQIPWHWITDTSRSVYRVNQWDDLAEYVDEVAHLYRRDLWRLSPVVVEVWCESESIASTISPVATEWRVGLYPIRGQCSESYAYAATSGWWDGRPRAILYVGDHDPAGLDIEAALQEKLTRFAGRDALHAFHRVGVTWAQVEELDLPGTRPKIRSASQAERYPWPASVEAEALPPQLLRDMLAEAIREYVNPDTLNLLRTVEQEERGMLLRLKRHAIDDLGVAPDDWEEA